MRGAVPGGGHCGKALPPQVDLAFFLLIFYYWEWIHQDLSGTWSVNQFEYDPCLLMFLVFAAIRECGGEDGPVAGEAQSVQTAETGGDPPEVNQPTLQPEARGDPAQVNHPTLQPEGRGDTPEVNQPTLQPEARGDPAQVNHPTLQPEGRGDTPEVNQPTLQSRRAFRDYVRPCWQMMCIRYVWM